MVVNYSKWDALELSDDSDIEVHPNVDKRSFIRAKQNQIHQQRFERKHRISTLKYERVVNDGMLERIDALLASLRRHADQVSGSNPDEFMMQALVECAGDPAKDKAPDPPPGVHYNEEQPLYSQMIAGLADQVKKEVGSEPKDWYTSYVKGVESHKTKVQKLQKDLLAELDKLEKEESKKITSESIHEGFNISSVSKEKANPKPELSKTVEVLNPSSLQKDSLRRLDSNGQTSGADADVDEPGVAIESDEADIEPTKLGKEFAKIKYGDYRESLKFISEHHEIVTERETDGLLMEAFNAQMDGKDTYAQQCVHQALLLQYCRSLGKDGVGLFFKRITTPNHTAQKVFLDDVNSTYTRIRNRTAELAKERANRSEQDVEQIQLHAVEPGTEIHINVPQADSKDDVEQQARIIFERFPPGLQRALESGSLDRVNEVLGKMSVSEAEEVVEQLGEAGMLSIEGGVIDPNTAEGKDRLAQMEREAREVEQVKEIGVPGDDAGAEAALKDLDMEEKGKAPGKEVEDAGVD